MTTKGRKAKVRALVARPGTPGEKVAAEAALTRITGSKQVPALRTARLTDALARKLPLPVAGHLITWDDDCAGFGCRVTAAGARAFVFNYRVKGSGQQRRITIGSVADWSASTARIEAKRLRRLVDGGGDPRGDHEQSRDAPTMSELLDQFEAEYLPRKRPNTIRSYRTIIGKHIRPHFGKFTAVADVEFADVDKLHREVTLAGSTYAANRCVALLSRIFSMAIKWKIRSDNPAKSIERNPESKRKRYLSGDELVRLTAALAETPDRQFTTIIALLLLTGARRSEVLGMRWDDLQLIKGGGIWTKAGSTTKQRTDHVTPLSEPACQLLAVIKRNDDSEFVFPSDSAAGHLVDIKKGWASLLARAGIKSLRLHDLRHSYASQLVSSGASLELIGAMLGHSSPVTTARYSHLYDSVQREAAERVGRIIGDANGGDTHGGDSNGK